MPKKKRNKAVTNDFTIKDFADSNFNTFRPKKSSNVLAKPEPIMLLNNDEDRNWDDSEDELDVSTRDENKLFAVTKTTEELDDAPGVVYPVAIWFHISEFILPEDIGRFAAICKGSHYTTTFAKFWINTYKKYCKPFTAKLPKNLHFDSINRRHGLRSMVIRSLFTVYPPMSERPLSMRVCTPEQLLKCRCASIWFKRVKSRWHLYFKMVLPDYPTRKPVKNLMDLLDDIHANSQAGYRVLEVTCNSFTEYTAAMGMVLTVIKASVGNSMSSHRLTLGFSAAVHAQPGFTVMADNVVQTKVYDWWHPNYPHPGENLPTSSAANPNLFNLSFDALDS